MTIHAVRLYGVPRCGAHAAQDVQVLGDRLQVSDVRAVPDSAQVIKDKAIRDNPGEKLVHETVHEFHPRSHAHQAVAKALAITAPQKAASFWLDDQASE